MSGKAGLIAAGIAATALLGTGGYFANEWRVCSNLQDQYLASVKSYAANSYSTALIERVGVEVDQNRHEEVQSRSLELQKMQLTRIYDRCGTDPGNVAADLASGALGKTMRDVLMIP